LKTQVRILLAAALLVLAAGWLGLRGGNAALERQLASAEVKP
jgi:hypothetical protein